MVLVIVTEPVLLKMVADGVVRVKFSRVKNFYQIPKQYLKWRGYSYYRKMSQTYQLPLLGYLSPKEYLNTLNFQILDSLSLKPL